MAGSYAHAVTNKGKLLNPQNMHNMLDTPGDRFEALEEMYGMIWDLANTVSEHILVELTPAQVVEVARKNYTRGLSLSPGIQKPNK